MTRGKLRGIITMKENRKEPPDSVFQKHDPQEEEYAKLAESEGDKLDSRLFWFAGGVSALSLGYFQATGMLRADCLLICGYACLILGIVCLLASLQITSYAYGELSVVYRIKNNGSRAGEDIQKKLDRYGFIVCKVVLAFNIVSMVFILGGTVLLVIFMFMNA